MIIKKQHITFIYVSPIKNITGGHKYETKLRDVLGNLFNVKIELLFNHDKLNFIYKIFAPLLALKIIPHLKDSKLVVFNSTKGMYFLLLIWILRLLGYKTAIIHHHFISEEFTGIKGKIYGFVEKVFLKSTTHIITPSPYVKDLILSHLQRPSFLIPIPFDKPVSFTSSPKIGQLLYIGTIEPRKGLIYLIEALTLFNKPLTYHLNIIGKIYDKAYFQKLSNIISQYKLSVTFHGYLSDKEMSKIISESDIFVFPSLLEGFGMAVNEMRFYGLPIICFDNSALPYSVNNDIDGLLVSDKNSKKFSEAIEKIVSNRKYRQKLGNASLHRSEQLPSSEDFTRIVNDTFTNLINEY